MSAFLSMPKPSRNSVRFPWVLYTTLSAILLTLGCGSDGPFDYVPISGKVVYEDGSPLTAGQLRFESLAPPQGDAHPRPGQAHLNSDGTFDSVTSYKLNDGLVPGKHKVAISYATDADGNLLVPEEYTSFSSTPLVVDTADAPLEIVVPKP